jgi:hypothetical protein
MATQAASRTDHVDQLDHEHSHGHGRTHDHEHEDHSHDHPLDWVDLVRIGLVALACLASWLGLWQHVASFDVIALVAMLAGGYPIFKEALVPPVGNRLQSPQEISAGRPP